MEYNCGNLQKYTTKNPLKRLMIKKFQRDYLCLLNQLDLSERKFLDVGCGEGFTTSLIYNNLQTDKIVGIDCCDEALDYARQHCSSKIDFRKGNIYELDFADKEFDAVCATEVLEHLKYPEIALSEIIRISKKYVIISVPREPYFCLGNFLSGKNITRLGNPIDHINHYTKRKFKKFLEKNIPNANISIYNCWVWTLAIIEQRNSNEK